MYTQLQFMRVVPPVITLEALDVRSTNPSELIVFDKVVFTN